MNRVRTEINSTKFHWKRKHVKAAIIISSATETETETSVDLWRIDRLPMPLFITFDKLYSPSYGKQKELN